MRQSRRRASVAWGMAFAVFTVMTVVVFTMSAGPARAAEPDIEAMLAAIDEQSNFADTDFAAVMTMLIQDAEKGIEKIVVRQFRRDAEDKFLLLIQEPAQQRGQGYLQDGDNLWFYDPESRKFSHTSLKENFEGSDARNEDFAQSSLTKDYRVASYERGTLGQYSVYIVDLEAVHNEVPDPFLKLWITEDTNLALKVESYSLTKRLVRTALYPSYQKIGDAIIPRQMIFVDELIPGNKTQITLTEVSLERLEANIFTKAYVERVNR